MVFIVLGSTHSSLKIYNKAGIVCFLIFTILTGSIINVMSQDFTVQSKNEPVCIQQNKHLGKILFTKNDFAPFNIGETIQTPKKDINYYSDVFYCNLSIKDTYKTTIAGCYHFYVRYISLCSLLRLIFPHHPYW